VLTFGFDLEFGGYQATTLRGTPAFFINDYFIVGAAPFEILQVIVDRALSDTRA
jgi:protein-disulfide isomerase